MAYILSDIVTKVQKRIRDTGYDASEIKDYLTDTQNDVFNEYRLRFMQTTQTYTVTINNSDITAGAGAPANYVQALDLMLTSPGGERVIEYKEISQLDDLYPDASDITAHPAGSPLFWYYYAGIPRLYPAPDKAYMLLLRYWKKPIDLTTDAQVPELPSQFQELLVLGAAYRVLQVKDNYDQAAILQNKYDEILQKLVMQSAQVQTGRPTQMATNHIQTSRRSF